MFFSFQNKSLQLLQQNIKLCSGLGWFHFFSQFLAEIQGHSGLENETENHLAFP